jgi:methyltransferase (TIGR00027 family)
MPAAATPIQHISDTALWIAAFRAQESELPNAAFKDVLAGRLAGEKGRAIVGATPHRDAMAFAMVVRTCAIDRLVDEAIGKGIDAVINLAAGLDTRPYRMNLPSNLEWIEVDFPGVLDYKTMVLAGEKPNCRLQRIGCDLSVDKDRDMLFARLGGQYSKVLVITEGLIGYLTNEQATKLSCSIYEVRGFEYWIMDYSAGRFRRRRSVKSLEKILGDVKIHFDVKDPIRFFGRQGWKVDTDLHILDEADRIGRRLPLDFSGNLLMRLFGKTLREIGNKTYGYVLFDKG